RWTQLLADCLKNTNRLVYGAPTETIYRRNSERPEMIESNRRYFVHVSTGFIAGLTVLLSCSCSRTQNAQAEDLKASDIAAVAVAKASLEDMSRRIVLTAEFRPFQEIDVMAKIAGYVKKINVDVGDRVQEGQILALIEVPEMADDQARAQSLLSRSQAE